MALASAGFGSQTAVIGTTHTLATVVSGKTCVLYVDLVNLINGETVELAALEKVLSTSTARTVTTATFSHAGNGIAVSIPYAALYSVAFTLRQTTGVARVFDWSVRTLD